MIRKFRSGALFPIIAVAVGLMLTLWRLGEAPMEFFGELIGVPTSADGEGVRPAAMGKLDPAGKVRGYDKFEGVRLLERQENDGDSFYVDLGGAVIELRLYFVDAPETYLSDRHESQRRRVADQARAMGGISLERVLEVGAEAKRFVQEQLYGRDFTVYTYWEEVFDSGRYYGVVELSDGSDLASLLVQNGLARIHTKGPGSRERPVPTPDGTSFHKARDRLYALEREAQRARRGAWAH